MKAFPNLAESAMKILREKFAQDSNIEGTIVTVLRRQTNGTLALTHNGEKSYPYRTEFWRSQPNGEYDLYVTQGGIRNRQVPRDEKKSLRDVIRRYTYADEEGNLTFAGTLKITVFNGAVTQIRVEEQ